MRPAIDADPAATPGEQAPLLNLSGLSYTYKSKAVLRDINWRIESGQHWAIVGPNGAGKTSLARIVSGQARHFSGEYLRGAQIETAGVAYVCFEQQRALVDRDNKLDDSEFRADAADPGTRVADLLAGSGASVEDTRHWAKRLGIGHILQRGLRFISTGEMRKSLLARAILSQPALLILDSPLDGLDHNSRAAMMLALEELMCAGPALLLLCRDLVDVPDGVSHVLALDAGALCLCGTRTAVMSDPALHKLMRPPTVAMAAPPMGGEDYPPLQGPLLQLRNVSVSYSATRVLDQLNWRFDQGQHCHVIGPNGCGKTTLLSLITGDNHKAYGQDIVLFGLKRGSGESVWDIKQQFGQVDTNLHLKHVRGMKVLEVVLSGFFDSIGLYDAVGDQQRTTALGWLAALGLPDTGACAFDDLSFGCQRLALVARALVKTPRILILDEPTLGLDGHHRQLVINAVDHVATRSSTQIIWVSHARGDAPQCINQWLEFVPREQGFEVVCRESS